MTTRTGSLTGRLDGGLRLVDIDVDSKLVFERHYEFHNVERVGAKVVDEVSSWLHDVFVEAQPSRNDFTDSLFDVRPLNVVASHSRAHETGNRFCTETDRNEVAAGTSEQHAASRAECDPGGLTEFWQEVIPA